MAKNLLFLNTAIFFLIFGCTSSRVVQCNQLTETINQADIATLGAKTALPADLVIAADRLDQIVQELKTVEIEDKQLRSLQGSFVLMYTDFSQLFRNTAIAISKQDRQGVKSYLKSLQEANQQDRLLVEQINTYCAEK